MTGHVMRVEWSGGSFPTYTVVCNEPPEADCRSEFDCDCEEYSARGIDADGPWHSLTSGYLTDEELRLPPAERPRHRGKHGGECDYTLWLNHGDSLDELGHGSTDVPVTFAWDGDGYEWHIAETTAVAP